MTKQKYKEVLETQYNDVVVKIQGWHELPNVLQGVVSLEQMKEENAKRGYLYDEWY